MKWFCLLLSCIAFTIGVFLGKAWFTPKSHISNDSTVVLERIKDVFKLVFVEANFNELYSHKDYHWIDISPFRKSAVIRIQANVTAGVNMDSSSIFVDENSKTIRLKFDHRPVLLYTDHKLDYYDLHQGTFNSFTSSELTSIQDKAKEIIRSKAIETDLLPRAGLKRDEMIDILNQLVKSLGWRLIIEDAFTGEILKK